MELKKLFLVVLACMTLGWVQVFAQISPDGNGIVYVKAGDNGTGNSWDNAADLSTALTAAAALGSDIKEIWVATGTYTPGTLRTSTFSIPVGVKVYGGFAGTEASLALRSISENATILSGDIGTLVTNTDNVYHVVTIAGNGVVLDGFTIRDGYANGTSPADVGGGIYINAATDVTLRNLTVTENRSFSMGAGIYSVNSNFTMDNSIVYENTAQATTILQYAGGIGFSGNGNEALLRNSLICRNIGTSPCRDIYLYSSNVQGVTMTLENTTVVSNVSNSQAVQLAGQSPTLILNNSIITTTYSSGQTIWDNALGETVYVNYSYFQSGTGGSNPPENVVFNNSIDRGKDPTLFFSSLAGGNYTLVMCSPLVNAGSNDLVSNEGALDLAGNFRIFDTSVDIGCFEFQTPALPLHVLTLNGDEELLNQNIKRGSSISPLEFSYSGGATDAQVEGLPAGVVASVSGGTITISGTPDAANDFGIYNYTVSTTGETNSCTPVATIEGSIILSPNVTPTDGVLYVKKGGTGRGSSWEDALGELSEAALAAADAPDVKQIWVGTGTPGVPATFTPAYAITEELDWEDNPATNRDNTFLLLDGIKIYGGFDPDGGISDLEDKRDSSLTILSGLLPGEEGEEDIRVYHVVTAVNHTATTSGETNHIVIDGFTIAEGLANGTEVVSVGSFEISQSSGAGVHAQAGEGFITITASEIQSNTANYSGGGVYADAPYGSIFVTGNTIQGNTIQEGESAYGGGIYAYGYVKITENEISGNEASGSSEARGGGIYARYNKFARSTGGGNVESSSIPFAPFAIGDEESEPIKAMYIGYNRITGNTALNDKNAAGGGIALWNYYGGSGGNESFAPASIGVDGDNRALIVYNTLEGNTAGSETVSMYNTGGGISAGYNTESVADRSLLRAATEVRFSGDVVIGYNLLKGNTVYGDGGGIYTSLEDADINIVNNVIVENTATNDGGGIYLPSVDYYYYNIYTLNNTIADNTAGNNGGGMYHDLFSEGDKSAEIYNTILYGNQASEAGNDLYLEESAGYENSWFYNNLIGSVEGSAESLIEGNGNIIGNQGDVIFVGGNADNKYSLATGSPAIDKGSNQNWTYAVNTDTYPDVTVGGFVDFVGNDRFMSVSIDIGAYEFDPTCIPVMVWLGGKSDNEHDWNTDANWYPAGIPGECTDVYIPGTSVADNASYYFPNLTDEDGGYECDRIFFLPGAQLGNQSRLSYNEAHVEIDYSGEGSSFTPAKGEDIFDDYTEFVALGSADKRDITSEHRVQFGAKYSGVTLDRGRWNMLSAPLKELKTGDFAFGGFPFSFIKKFDTEGTGSSYITGKWADFQNETNLGFTTPGFGFGHYYYAYMDYTPYGMDDSEGQTQWNAAKSYSSLTANDPTHIDGNDKEFGLAQSNGILHFPYFADGYLSDARRSHQYSGTGTGAETSGTSTFSFFYQSPLTSSYFLQWTGKTETVDRTGSAYRFITEGWNGEYTLSGAFEEERNFALIGNPYMGALDFDVFYSQNNQVIKPVYQIYQAPGVYYVYDNDENSGNDNHIAPMQSFLVELAEGVDEDPTFTFTDAMSTVNTTTKLRAAHSSLPTDRLTITARNANGETKTTVHRQDNAKDGFCNGDFSLIIDNPDKLPRVYTLVRTNSGKPRALFTNSIQSDKIAVPVGLVSTQAGNIEFTITGMDTYDAKVYFVDMVENTQTEITGESAFRYEFAYTPDASSVLENRFLISFAPGSSTGINPEGVEVKNLTAYASGEDLIVISTETALIQTVAVYDLQGRCLAREEAGQVSTFRMKNALQSAGVYLVKVQTPLGVKEIKVIK